MVELIIQYFRVKRDTSDPKYGILTRRQREYSHCLRKNLACEFVNSIHILYETKDDIMELKRENIDPNHPKIVLYHLGKYMHYKDAYTYANQYLEGKICIVLHTDIFLVDGFQNIRPSHLDNKIYALARTNVDDDGTPTGRGIRIYTIPNDPNKYCATIDGWAFVSPLNKKVVTEANHQQNVWGAENRMVYIFRKYGYQVTTPLSKLKMVHFHKTDIRPNQNQNWITAEGNLIPATREYYLNVQKKNPHLVGGGIPKELGCSIITEDL